MKKRQLALLLAVMMLLAIMPTAMASSTGSTATISVGSTLAALKYVVAVPKTFAVTMDPYRVKSQQGLQSAGTTYFVNASNIPVLFKVSMLPTLAATTEILAASATPTDLTTVETKTISMYAEFPSALGTYTNLTSASATLDQTAFVYPSDTSNQIPFAAWKSGQSAYASTDVSFLLAASNYNASDALVDIPADSITGFRFGGDLSTKAAWAAGDIKVNVIYEATSVMLSAYDAIKNTSSITGDAHHVHDLSALLAASATNFAENGFTARQHNVSPGNSVTLALYDGTISGIEFYTNATGTTKYTANLLKLGAGADAAKVTAEPTFRTSITLYAKVSVNGTALPKLYPITFNYVASAT